eukprot:TRINITY_DN5331_c0_g1_i1.p1 TRINITY_DN5331_c0_g1~~TRINITY_DN5331_c0_g1_i1.p1  ORF type:complete len:250 (+),score=69.82 TRINITY_DN5331_c0_g1_i1:52-801(+)
MTETRNNKIIALFDIDGTLTPSRGLASKEIVDILAKLKQRVVVGFVGGSDFDKQKEQMGDDVLNMCDYSFSENGLVAYKGDTLIHRASIKDFLGEDKIKEFVNFCLHYIADLEIPQKRGTFIEFRSGLINICPVGRNCSQEERINFNTYDNEHHVREAFVSALEEKFESFGLKYSIGGQISFDVFPIGWDKTYCLNHIRDEQFEEIHFFGDKTYPGGNDYEIYSSEETIGHSVTCPEDTIAILNELFLQ